jgi:hypothetical protein
MATNKQNDQKIPPLLPLEYCTVERVARLLGCEVEDIYHWREIGAIDFYCKYDGKAKLSMEQVVTDDGPLTTKFDFANELAGGWREQIRKILSHMKTSYSWFLIKEFISNPICPYKVSSEYEVDEAFAETNDQVQAFKWYEQSVLNPENDIFIQCSGFWRLDSSFIDEATDSGIECSYLHPHSTPEIESLLREWNAIMYIYDLDIHIPRDKYEQSLYLVKSDIQKIHRATLGLEELQTIYNNTKIYEDKRKQNVGITIPKLKTSHNVRGVTLGIMAKLLAESKGRKLKRGENVNASALMTMINQECGCLGIEDLSEEVRKDISQCVSVINGFIEHQKK